MEASRSKVSERGGTFGLLALILCGALLPASNLEAQTRQPGDVAAANRVVTRWDRLLRSADELLAGVASSDAAAQRKAAKKARRQLGTVFADCLKYGLSGEAVERRLALAFVLDSIAARSLENDHEADWARYSALELWPEAAGWDLSVYGPAADFDPVLETAGDRALLEAAIANPVSKEVLEEHFKDGLPVRSPVATSKPLPRIRAARPTHSGQLVIRFHITADGLPSVPRLVESSVPSTYLAAALRSYGDWRFEPQPGVPPGLLTVQTMRIRW